MLTRTTLFVFLLVGCSIAVPLLGHFRYAAPPGPNLLNEVEKWLGRDLDLGHDFGPEETWANLEAPVGWQLSAWGAWVKQKPGRRFLYSVRPWPINVGGNLDSCASGQYNSHYATLGKNLVANNLGNAFIRFAWEWSGSWFTWGAPGKETQYAACFRQFVTQMRAASGNSFKFDWNANGDFQNLATWKQAYPGNDYVDIVSVDQYDLAWNSGSYPFPSGCDVTCQDQRRAVAWTQQVNGINAMSDFGRQNGKQLALPEWALWGEENNSGGHSGLDNPVYIQKVYEWAMNPNNNVAYIVYFDTQFDTSHMISDVDLNGGHTYQTDFPRGAAKYIELFSKWPKQSGAVTPTSTSTSTSTSLKTSTSTSTSTSLRTSTSTSTSTSMKTSTPVTTSTNGNYGPLLGAYHFGAPSGPAILNKFSEWLGRSLDLGSDYQGTSDWSFLEGPDWQLSPWRDWLAAKPSRRFVYAVAPFPTTGNNGEELSLAACARGAYNSHYTTLANNLANGLTRTIIRFANKWNGSWLPWYAAGKEADYAECFRQFVTTVRYAQPKAGFEFDWNPTEDISWYNADPKYGGQGDGAFQKAYPGNAYVDYIGIDSLDTSWNANTYPYPSPCDSNCMATQQTNGFNDVIQGANTMRDFAKANGKKIAFPEWGVWTRSDGHGGNDNAIYVQLMYNYMMDPNNVVAYQCLYDANVGDGNHQISDVSTPQDGNSSSDTLTHTYPTTFPNAARAYRQLFSVVTGSTTGVNTYDNYGTFPLLQGQSSAVGVKAFALLISSICLILIL